MHSIGQHDRSGARVWRALNHKNTIKATLFSLVFLVASVAHGATPGAKLFLACQGCHSVSASEHGVLGPSLHALIGRTAGSATGYEYSVAMKQAGEQGLRWTPQALDKFLANPSALVPENKMQFTGLSDPADRVLLIEYITAATTDNPAIETHDDPPVAPEILAIKGDLEYGEYLGNECLTCHQADGSSQGIPSIVGWQPDRFVRVMHAYKQQVRENPVMQSIAGALGAEEIAALAAYFQNLK